MTTPSTTRTTHLLPFNRLSAEDFERLCLWLVRREGFEGAEHLGAAGQEGGRDVVAWRGGERVVFQCKRYKAIRPRDAEAEVDKILNLPDEERPAELIFVVSCNLSAAVRQRARRRAGSIKCGFWAGTELDERVKRHPDIVDEFFGPGALGADHRPAGFRSMAPPSESFVQRQQYRQVLAALCRRARSPEPESAMGLTIALLGAGGFGKTAMAQALCADPHVQDAFCDGILWISMGEALSDSDRLARIRDLLRWWTSREPPGFETAAAASAFLRASLAGRRVLLVIDDVWHSADLAQFRGLGAGTALLVTTRNRRALPAAAVLFAVDAMQVSEAIRLLASGLRPPVAEESLARLATTHLGRWPLLLRLVNRQIRQVTAAGLGVEAALRHVTEDLEAAGLTAFDAADAAEREQAVSRTMEVSLRRLSEEDRARFEDLVVFPEDADVPLAALERLWSLAVPEVRRLTMRLHDLSLLLRYDQAAHTIRLHDVVRHYLIALQGGNQPLRHRRLVEAYRSAAGGQLANGPNDGYYFQRLVHHLAAAGMAAELKATLLDFDFLYAKLCALGPQPLIDDFNEAMSKGHSDKSLRLVQSALRLSAHVLAGDPSQMPGQILGRLLSSEDPEIRALVRHLRGWNTMPWLHPVSATLEPAGGPLLRTIATPGGLGIWEDGELAQLALTPDGGHAVCACGDRKVRVFDLDTGDLLLTLEGHWSVNPAISLTPDGKRLVTSAAGGAMRLWDLLSGGELRTLPPTDEMAPDDRDEDETPEIIALAVGPDGRRVVARDDMGGMGFWDLDAGPLAELYRSRPGGRHLIAVLQDGRRALTFDDHGGVYAWDLELGRESRLMEIEMRYGLVAAAVTPDGRALAVSDASEIYVRSLETGEQTALLRVSEGESIRCLAITADGRRLISGGMGGSGMGGKGILTIWDLNTGEPERRIDGHDDDVEAVVIAADGRRLLSGSRDRTLKLWDLDSSDVPSWEQGHASSVATVAVDPEAKRAASAAWESVKVWDLASGREATTFSHEGDPPREMAFSPDGQFLALLADSLRIWDVYRVAEVGAVPVPEVTGFTFDFDSRRIVTLAEFNYLKALRCPSGSLLQVCKGPDAVRSLVLTPDGNKIISLLAADSSPRVWNLENGEEVAALHGHRKDDGGMESFHGWVSAVAALPDGRRAVAASYEGSIGIWDLRNTEEVAVLRTPDSFVETLAAMPDGERLICGCSDHTVRVVETRTGKNLACLAGHQWHISSLVVTPDRRRAVSASYDRTLRIWDLEAGREVHVRELPSEVEALALTPDGRTAVSACEDRTLGLWDVGSGKNLRTWKANAVVDALAALPGGGRVLAASRDGRLTIWDLGTGGELLAWRAHPTGVSAVALTPDGLRAISGSEDRTIRMWNLATGNEIKPPPGLGSPTLKMEPITAGASPTTVTFDLDLDSWILRRGGELRALGPAQTTRTGHVQVYSEGRMLMLRETQAGSPPSLLGKGGLFAMGPEGRRLVSKAGGDRITLWDLRARSAMASFSFGAEVRALAISPDEEAVVVGTESGRVHILKLAGAFAGT